MQDNIIWNSLFGNSSPKASQTVPMSPKTPVLALQNRMTSPSMLSPPMKKNATPTVQSLESLPIYESFQDSGYELIEEIGSGSFGSVWRARKGREFAIKKFNVKRPEARNAFMRELAAQFFIEQNSQQFCENTAVCGTTAFIVDNQTQTTAYIVYPFVVAGDLATLIEGWHRETELNKENADEKKKEVQDVVNLQTLIRLGVNFLFNIAKMHENNIVHRDIKPENVLVYKNKRDHSVFIDFGSACFISYSSKFDEQLLKLFDRVEKQIGKVDRDLSCIPIDTTLLYVDPELAEIDAVDDKKKDFELGKQADVFAAAVVLYELFLEKRAISLLTSKNPIALLQWQPDTKLLQEMGVKNSQLSKTYIRLAMLIDSMLRKDEPVDVYAEQLATIGKLLQDGR